MNVYAEKCSRLEERVADSVCESSCRISATNSIGGASNESFGRMSRLLEQHVPVSVSVNIHAEFTGDLEIGYNTIAEIPGVDPVLKKQVVMADAHLDS